MMKNWMIAGLMGATILTGVTPSAAAAAEQERAEGRWPGRDGTPRAEVDSERSRPEIRARWRDEPMQASQERTERVEAAREDRRDRVEAAREARRDRVEAVQDRRREWRQDAREDRRDWQRDRQDRRDWREDRRDWREDRRDWRDNRNWDYRDSSQRYRWDRDWRRDQRYDWQRYRQTHRHIYRGPRYYAPRGWDYGYRRFSIGIALFSGLYADRYWINDPWYYRLPPAYGPLRWVRYYDDALLVDIRTGYVVDVIYDFFW